MPQRLKLLRAMQPVVFLGSAAIVIGFVLFGEQFTPTAAAAFRGLQSYIVETFGGFYLLTATTLLITVVWLLFSRFGSIRLGGEKAAPEFGYLSWFSMLMSAGMGIGVVFFGVAEPMLHYLSPPTAAGETAQAVREAMRFSFFHWGFHPWAIYTAIALPLAYFHFRHGLPLAPRSLLYPLLGERIHGPWGHAVDILCTVGTLFGVATSLGLGSIQINAGLDRLLGVEQGTQQQVLLIAGITAIATLSVVSGLHLGIRYLSRFNIGLAGMILLFVLVAGPTVYIIELFVSSLGHYLQTLPGTSLWINPAPNSDWQADWTLFYWSWWISWPPLRRRVRGPYIEGPDPAPVHPDRAAGPHTGRVRLVLGAGWNRPVPRALRRRRHRRHCPGQHRSVPVRAARPAATVHPDHRAANGGIPAGGDVWPDPGAAGGRRRGRHPRAGSADRGATGIRRRRWRHGGQPLNPGAPGLIMIF